MTRRELARLAGALLLIPAVEGALSVSRQRVPLLPLLVASVYAGVLWVLLDRARTLAWQPERIRHRDPRPHTHEPFMAVNLLERRLRDAERRPLTYEHELRPRLRRLVEARLADRHGLTLDGPPERVRAAVGERLWEMLTRPKTGDEAAPDLDELEALVTEVEKL